MCKMFDIRHYQTPAYHPQANGDIERLHRRLKDALRAWAATADWFYHLPWVLLAIRTAARDDKTPSPAELLFGAQLVVSSQFLAPNADLPQVESFLQQLRTFADSSAPPPIAHHRAATATATIPAALLNARHVFVRHDAAKPPLAPTYDGPFLVLERSPHTFRIQIGDKTDEVATARLKAAHLPSDAAVAVPRRRGCPPTHGNPATPAPATCAASPTVDIPASPASSKHVSFATAVAAAPTGRPQPIRCQPHQFLVSSLCSETWGEV
jgi:hypothetical protein